MVKSCYCMQARITRAHLFYLSISLWVGNQLHNQLVLPWKVMALPQFCIHPIQHKLGCVNKQTNGLPYVEWYKNTNSHHIANNTNMEIHSNITSHANIPNHTNMAIHFNLPNHANIPIHSNIPNHTNIPIHAYMPSQTNSRLYSKIISIWQFILKYQIIPINQIMSLNDIM